MGQGPYEQQPGPEAVPPEQAQPVGQGPPPGQPPGGYQGQPPGGFQAPPPAVPNQRTSVYPIIGLPLAFVALLFFPPIFGLAALVLGIVGLVETNNKPEVKGRGLAIATIVLGPVCLVLGVLIGIAVVKSMN